uniref:MAM domain-containing protein n=1 Tax=Heterorhabditis bacteriophora TaxID=37862 RepID=A0A1I7WGB3_HETBA
MVLLTSAIFRLDYMITVTNSKQNCKFSGVMQVVLSILSILHFCLLCNSSSFPPVFDCDFEVDLCGWSIESPWEKILMKQGSMYHNLDTISAVPAEEWTQCVIVLPPCEVQHQIVFRVSKIRSGFDVIAVDNIALKVIDLKPGAEEERSFSNWKLLDRKIVTEGQGDGILSSDPVLLPMNAHFEVNVFASELSSVTISQVSGSEESLIWTQSGIALVGWNKIRLPLRLEGL